MFTSTTMCSSTTTNFFLDGAASVAFTPPVGAEPMEVDKTNETESMDWKRTDCTTPMIWKPTEDTSQPTPMDLVVEEEEKQAADEDNEDQHMSDEFDRNEIDDVLCALFSKMSASDKSKPEPPIEEKTAAVPRITEPTDEPSVGGDKDDDSWMADLLGPVADEDGDIRMEDLLVPVVDKDDDSWMDNLLDPVVDQDDDSWMDNLLDS